MIRVQENNSIYLGPTQKHTHSAACKSNALESVMNLENIIRKLLHTGQNIQPFLLEWPAMFLNVT